MFHPVSASCGHDVNIALMTMLVVAMGMFYLGIALGQWRATHKRKE